MEHMTTVKEALAYYLPPNSYRIPPVCGDLITAGKQAARRRKEGPEATKAILRGLHIDFGLSYRQIEAQTGIPIATVSRMLTGGTP